MTRYLFVFIFLALLVLPLGAEISVEKIRWEPLPVAEKLSLEQNPSIETLKQAALAFSGIGDDLLPAYAKKLDLILAAVTASFAGKPVTAKLADDLLQFLHQNYLKRYNEPDTTMQALLDRGQFNCVSSAVFYLLAAQTAGIRVAAVQTKTHAFCRVSVGNQDYDVETTSRFGFNPQGKREFFDEFGGQTGFVYAPPGNYRDRTDISGRELVSLILYNRIAIAEKSGRHEEAITAAVDFFAAGKTELSMMALQNTVSNLSVAAITNRYFQSGLRVMDLAVFSFRELPEFAELRRDYIKNWVGALINQGKPDEARTVAVREHTAGKISTDDLALMKKYIAIKGAEMAGRSGNNVQAMLVIENAVAELGPDEKLAEVLLAHTRNAVIELVEKADYAAALALCAKARGDNRFDEKVYVELVVFNFQKRAEAEGRRERFEPGLAVLEEGLALLPGNSKLVQMAGAYAYNAALAFLRAADFEAAKLFIDSNRAKAVLAARQSDELLLYYWSQKAAAVQKSSGALPAAVVIREGIAEIGKQANLVKSYETYVHTGVASLITGRELARAEKILTEALMLLPASAILKKDLETVKNLSR